MGISTGKNYRVEFDHKALGKKWGRYNDQVAKAMTDATVQEMKKLLKAKGNSSGMTPSQPGQAPAAVSGDLIKSIKSKKTANKETQSRWVIEINSPYAKILENGGTISAKRSQYLTIPLNQEAVKLRQSVKSLRTVSGLFVIQKKGKEPMLVKRTRDGFKPMFALKRTVYIAPRPYIRPAIQTVLKNSKEIIKQVREGQK